MHWPNSLVPYEGKCTVCEQPWVDLNAQPSANKHCATKAVHRHINTYIYMHTYIHIYIHTDRHTYIHTFIHCYTHKYMRRLMRKGHNVIFSKK